eukprot:COSAG02_NODE_22_length_53020_cov_16.223125_51_plen_99_part_00
MRLVVCSNLVEFLLTLARALSLSCFFCWHQVFVNQSTFNFPGITQHGYKQSGLGTEGGLEGLLEYMEVKSIAKNVEQRNVPTNFMRDVREALAPVARL